MKACKNYLAPGHVLQNEFLKEELKLISPGSFLDVGCGIGLVSQCLLEMKWAGYGIDLNDEALSVNKEINREFIEAGKYIVENGNFLEFNPVHQVAGSPDNLALNPEVVQFDLVISSMVVEHLSEPVFSKFIEKMKRFLRDGGNLILIVPGSPMDWGIEDEVVGHVKRYTTGDMADLSKKYNLSIIKNVGLTFPLSNWLLGLSNYLVKKNEAKKLAQGDLENTVESSLRKNQYKTEFPCWTKILINKFTLYPFLVLQKVFHKHPRALVIYSRFQQGGN